jgi:hypothetical protein
MVLRSSMIALAAVALALGACRQSPPAPPPKPAATPLQTIERRPGIWKYQDLMTLPSGARTAQAQIFCVGPPWETTFRGDAAARKGCAAYDLERQADGDITLHSVCPGADAGGSETAADEVIHGDMNTKFTETGSVTVTDPKQPPLHGSFIRILTWERPCRAGETPGKGLSQKVVTEAGDPTAPIDLDPGELKYWDATK